MKLKVCCLSLALITVPRTAAADSTLDDEASLIAVIQSEDTSLEARGVACRRLAVVGSRQAIAPLAALLGHAQLAHLARYGLEPMPYPEVDEDQIGSRLWTLQRHKALDETRGIAEDLALEALQWMIDDGVAGAVEVVESEIVTFAGRRGIALQIAITRPGEVTPRLVRTWEVALGAI